MAEKEGKNINTALKGVLGENDTLIGLVDGNVRQIETDVEGGLMTFDKGVSKSDINVENGVTGFEPIGEVKQGDKRAVSGEEVFEKAMTKTVYLEKERESPNLFDKSKIQVNRSIRPNGELYNVVSSDDISDWIFLPKGEYVASGWFRAKFDQYYSLFSKYGDTTPINPTRYAATEDKIIIENDCYIVLLTRRTPGSGVDDAKDTLQLEKGSVPTPYQSYSDVYKDVIKKEYLPKIDEEEITLSNPNNLFEKDKVFAVKLNNDGSVTDSEGFLTTDFIKLPMVTFLFIRGLGKGDFQRNYKFYDANKNPLSYNYYRFNGDWYRFHLLSTARYMRIQIQTDLEPKLNLDNVSISPYKNVLNSEGNVLNMVGTTEYNLAKYEDNNGTINSDLNVSFKINSDKDIKNALVPIFLHKGQRLSGVSITERDIYLGDNLQNDFSDVGIFQNGKLLNSRLHSGNYALLPQNSYVIRMAQDKQDGYILGSNNYEGVYKSIDNGLTWTNIKQGVKLVFLASNGDIFFQRNTGSNRELFRATKSSNFEDENLIYTTTRNLVMGFSLFVENEINGDIYFGTYQEQFNVEVYKSTNKGVSFTRVFYNQYKQHVHKIWIHNGVVFIDVDGGTLNNPNDEESINNSMACYKSEDNGATWEMVKFEWSSDYGINTYNNGYFYGGAEAGIKYSPSIFKSKDLENWKPVWNMPANSQSLKTFDNKVVNCLIAYNTFNRAKNFITENGEDYLPIFDTKHMDSNNLATALRMGSQENPNVFFTDSEGNKWVPLSTEVRTLTKRRLILGGNHYQALAYIQCDLVAGENSFEVKNTNVRKDIVKDFKDDSIYSIEFKEKYLIDGNGVFHYYPENTIISNGRFEGLNYPFKLKEEVSVNLRSPILINNNVKNIKSIRFGYKNYRWNAAPSVGVIDCGNFKIVKKGSDLVVNINSVDYTFTNALRVYYDSTCLDVTISLTGSKINIFLNGYPQGSLDCTETIVTANSIEIQKKEEEISMDFISNIEFYDYSIDGDRSKELFEGFNII